MFKAIADTYRRLETGKVGDFGTSIATPAKRRWSLVHFHLFDHAILRGFWTNTAEVAPGVWRANQPSPARIARYRAMGIGTIINLRGVSRMSYYLLEKQACIENGIALETVTLFSRDIAKRKDYLALLDLFDTLEKPFLFHCKSGADRAGLAAALYLLHTQNVPVAVARKQLSVRYLHIRWSLTGILDHMLDVYESDTARLGPIPVRTWLEHHFDENAIKRSFLTLRSKKPAPSR